MIPVASARGRWWIPAFLLAGMSLVVLAVLNPHLIVQANTPTGGDMGAHVLGPAYLRDVLLPQGRVLGWSQAWFAGFPAFYFYFPLPSLVIVLLDVFLPYGVAFKVVTVLGLLGTPPAAYYLARSLNLGRVVSAVAAAAGVVFVFMESYTIYGANIASTLAGEFSFSWSFAFSLVYLANLIKGLRDDRRFLVWAAVFLGLTALCHIITTIVVVLASIPVLFWKRGLNTVLVWLGGFALAGFWALPLLMRIGYTSDMAWTPLSKLEEILPAEIWLLLPLAVAGAVILARRSPRVIPVATFTLLPVIYFPLPSLLHETFPDVFTESRWKLWNGRLLPYWYFGVAFLAAIAVGFIARWIIRRLPERASMWWGRGMLAVMGAVAVASAMANSDAPGWLPWTIAAIAVALFGLSFLYVGSIRVRSLVVAAAGVVLALGGLAGVSFVDGWAKWNYEGYEAKEPWPEYRGLMETIATLPPGRVVWEPDSGDDGLNKYGTPMSPMLIPYWTKGTHPSMEGLYFESSLTTPFHFILAGEMAVNPSNPVPGLTYHNFAMERGVRHMELYGVRYYVAYNEEAAEKARTMPELQYVTESPPFTIFEMVETPSIVEPATFQPVVYEAPDGGMSDKVLGLVGAGAAGPTFNDVALEWFDDVDLLDLWVTADGPENWPRIDDLSELPRTPLPGSAEGAVTEVEVEDHRLSFTTSAVGVPHLVKVSYFPNWVAEGAEGPYHAAPSLMVVVPTDEEVVLEFRRQWPEYVGWFLTVAALGGLAGLGVRKRRRGFDGSATDRATSAAPA
ncbi:MAG TPA: hypothetical protein VK011_06815 [Acidimicrobiia bacterium]|nr:hypothetical protein [Acidimicrobiia bacterium]